ncbi:baseplate J/gp47 family protein [Pelotomaculum propionicicum]|uniref:baseplate J/gp47 family protein n=1 Tax=Pelotomaculum propionicicum TaxID=258475 RepID=UPI003B798A2A
MAVLPEYLTEQTEEAIKQRILDALPDDLDKTEGSYIWDAVSPVAIELALAAIWAKEVLRRGFASTTFGDYLDLRCEEHGLTRIAAVKATGTTAKGNSLTITGTPGKVNAGLRVATQANPVTNTPSIEFLTTTECNIESGGTGTADIEAVVAGTGGNVPAGAISVVVDPYVGVTGVTNSAPITGGLNTETDAALLARYLQKVRSPSAGGNKADYLNWALEVAGVGGVAVTPVRDGPGTVSVAIIGTDKAPASQTLVDAVQNYIAPSWINEKEAENMTIGGFGVFPDNQPDDTGSSVKIVYDTSGIGTVTHTNVNSILQQPGIWQARNHLKVDNISGVNDLLEVGMYNVSGAVWCKTRPEGSTDAKITLKASDLGTTFTDKIVEFYWNGSDQIELRIKRLAPDTTAVEVCFDRTVYRSTFSKDTGEGKAPVGARVTVEKATAVLINVSATLTIMPGYNSTSVKAAVEQNIEDYIRGLAFTEDNDVRYVRIGNAILDTPGVQDYTGFTVNGGTANITVGAQEVAVKGTVSLLP